MKQLFLKSNLLHIRLKEGEYEVSNPETIFHRSYTMPSIKSREVAYTVVDGLEWPYGVELIKMCASDVCDTDGACEYCREPKTLARLLPEEKKSESAYKEGERCTSQTCGDHSDHLRGEGRCESKPVSAPSESQEEIVKQIASIAWKGAANAYRMYPDNKHTFASYWDVAKDQFKEFFTRNP